MRCESRRNLFHFNKNKKSFTCSPQLSDEISACTYMIFLESIFSIPVEEKGDSAQWDACFNTLLFSIEQQDLLPVICTIRSIFMTFERETNALHYQRPFIIK